MVVAFSLWHLSFGGLKTLRQKNVVTGIPEISVPLKVCEECVVSKQSRSQFPKGKSWRANDVLELVHSDICGPINPSSNGGKETSLLSSMIFSEKLGCIFYRKN